METQTIIPVVILQQDAPVLRQKAKEVPVADIKGRKIRGLLADMRVALDGEHDGVGLAAPQIGESLRIFIVTDLVYRKQDLSKKSKKTDKQQIISPVTPLVFINPEIVSASKDKKSLEEGCLSVRQLYGMVKRSNKVTIRAYDENGQRFERGASGLLAQIFQHEIDHLNGILFIDKAKDLHEMEIEADYPKSHDSN